MIAASNALAIDLYQQNRSPNNTVFSPASISVAFAMTYAGARGDTAKQMRETLHFPEGNTIHGAAASVIANWNAPSGHVLNVVNRLFGQVGTPFQADFLSLVNTSYSAPLEEVAFAADPAKATKHINQWVMQQTNNKIEDLLPKGSITGNTKLVLVNAIYFLGTWASPFSEKSTRKRPFWVAGKTKQQVSMMSQTARYAFAETANARILEIPYKNSSLAMTIVLPKDKNGISALEDSLTTDSFSRWTGQLRPKRVGLQLPRFELKDARLPLKKSLIALGMKLPFNAETADFSGMLATDNPNQKLYISDAFHEAYVKVDEKGTEAAAATAVVMATRGRPMPATAFHADHPFLFAIRDTQNGALLFLGKVVDPR